MAGSLMAQIPDHLSLNAWATSIGQWHRMAFPWAKLPHVMDKLAEEKGEANVAWAQGDDEALAAELADCLVCVLAAMSREGLDVEQVLAEKFALVRAKYHEEQSAPCQSDLFKS